MKNKPVEMTKGLNLINSKVLLHSFNKIVDKEGIFNLEVNESESIEFHIKTVGGVNYADLAQKINEFDNLCKNKCIRDYLNGNIDERNYIFELVSVKIEMTRIELEYWGMYVNSQYKETFIYDNSKWINI